MITSNRPLLRFQQAVEAVQAYGPSMPLEVARTFIMVACDEGKTVSEYQKIAGVSQASMSRHLLDLGPLSRSKQPGMGLIKAEGDPMDLRIRRYSLTPRGNALAKRIREILA